MKSVYICIFGLFVLFASCSSSEPKEQAVVGYSSDKVERYDNLFKQARLAQKEKQFDQAIDLYIECLSVSEEVKDSSEIKALLPLVTDAMLQLMNSYQAKGEPEICADWFKQQMLEKNALQFVKNNCLRDLYVVAAYAISRTEDMRSAEQLIAKALKLPLLYPTSQRLFRDNAFAAAIYFSNPTKQEGVIEYCKEALKQAEQSLNLSGANYVKSMLGLIYKRMGKIREAVSLIEESIKDSQQRKDLLGEINGFNALSELMNYWQLYEEGNNFANHGLRLIDSLNLSSVGGNPIVESQLLLHKGCAMEALMFPDSALYYWKKAEDRLEDLPYNSGMVDVDLHIGGLMSTSDKVDWVKNGSERLLRVAEHGTVRNRAQAYFYLARMAFQVNNTSYGELYLDSLYALTHQFNSPIFIRGANELGLQHYVRKNDSEQIKRFAVAYLNEQKFNLDPINSHQVTKVVIQHYLKDKEQVFQLLEYELNNRALRLKFVLVLVLFLLIIGVVLYVYRSRIYRMRQRLAEESLNNLLNDRNAVLGQLEEARGWNVSLKERLETIQKEYSIVVNHLGDEQKRFNDLKQMMDELLQKSNEMRPVAEAISLSEAVKGGNFENFLVRFNMLYPTFQKNLKERIPTVGNREQFMCMLMVLGVKTEQIAELMGVESRSINMMRYRIRKKLALGKEESLEEIILQLAQ
ncbi:MAG: hypothetical protein IKU29_01740 [Parabacteroides sp.]|nr:hypothetical protein [Parabacteroides sp.]